MTYQSHTSRDLRLDFFRGLALITIFINHVPGTIYENVTTRNFGFSDAAEAFVFMSGIAAAFAYTGKVQRDFQSSILKGASRAFKLYWVHILITLFTVSMTLWVTEYLDAPEFLLKNNMPTLISDPLNGFLGVLTLGHQLGYLNILPLYAVLMLVAPFAIWAAVKRPYVLLATSGALWLFAGYLQANFPNYPTDGTWFLNPLSWQFLFVIGVLVGVGVKTKRPFASFNLPSFLMASAYLIGSLIVVRWQLWSHIQFSDIPEIIGGFNKTYLTVPRLLHILALAYVVIHIAKFSAISAHQLAAPIRYLGQNSLAVFATGTVISIFLQILKVKFEFSAIEDGVLLSLGFLVQFYLPAALEWRPQTNVLRRGAV